MIEIRVEQGQKTYQEFATILAIDGAARVQKYIDVWIRTCVPLVAILPNTIFL
jgi:hypothetical protein